MRSAFVLADVVRYAGMLSGHTLDGRLVSRPLIDFEAVSHDGIEWQPMCKLRHLIPWENGNVPEHLSMPE